jgi:hypothetical protein
MYWRLGKGYAHGNLYVYASFNGIIIVQNALSYGVMIDAISI